MFAINTLTYKLAKFLGPILKSLTSNESTERTHLHFVEEIVVQDHEIFMGSLNVDSLLTNIPLEATIEYTLFENTRFFYKQSKI